MTQILTRIGAHHLPLDLGVKAIVAQDAFASVTTQPLYKQDPLVSVYQQTPSKWQITLRYEKAYFNIQ